MFFDHGAPYFTIENTVVLDVIKEWKSRGLIAEWKEKFGAFDCISKSFIDSGEVSVSMLLFHLVFTSFFLYDIKERYRDLQKHLSKFNTECNGFLLVVH